MTEKSPKTIGYARVSRDYMNEDRQTDKLREICDQIYVEKLSAVAKKRPKFDNALTSLKRGDTLIVLDLDRAFRSSIDALMTMED